MSNARPVDLGAAVLSKVQRRLVPLLAACWFIAYIDRFNVSFAALQMNKDLGLSTAAFGFGAGVFFVGYSVFEIPSNLVLVRVGALRWLARIMVTWGILSAAMAFVSGIWSFYVLRFLLGVAEAGCFPAIAFYLSQWLAPRERTAALASIATMAMVSGIAAGPLAAVLLSLDGVLGLAGWRWLFLVEGLPAVALAAFVLRLPGVPNKASWLSDDESKWIQRNISAEDTISSPAAALRSVMSDRRYWVWAAAFFCAVAPGSALRLFQPTILRQMAGLGDAAAALLTAIPSAVGVAALLFVGRRSTASDERRWHAAVPIFVGALGLALVGVTYGIAGSLLVSSIATVGVAMQPPLFASVSAASRGATNAVGIAFVNSVSSIGAFLGPYLVGFVLDQTGSLGQVCLIAAGVMCCAGATVLLEREDVQVHHPLPQPVA